MVFETLGVAGEALGGSGKVQEGQDVEKARFSLGFHLFFMDLEGSWGGCPYISCFNAREVNGGYWNVLERVGRDLRPGVSPTRGFSERRKDSDTPG